MTPKQTYNEAGFTLIEALAALAITALMIGTFLPFVAQTLDRWTTGLHHAEVNDELMRASVRLQSEFAAISPIRLPVAGRQEPIIAFVGKENVLQFVKAGDEDNGMTLQTITFTIEDASHGNSLIRDSTDYVPMNFVNYVKTSNAPTAVITGPYRMRFSYVSDNGTKTDEWPDTTALPSRVELSIQAFNGSQSFPTTIYMLPVARINSD